MNKIIALLLGVAFIASCGPSKVQPVEPYVPESRKTAFELLGINGGQEPAYNDEDFERVGALESFNLKLAPGGAIFEVEAIAPSVGYHHIQLHALNNGQLNNGVIQYELRGIAPTNRNMVGDVRLRKIYASHFLSDYELEDLKGIQVIGLNSRTLYR